MTGYYANEEQARKNCPETDSAIFLEWLAEISHYQATVIIGFNEREGNHIYDSAAVVEKGSLLGVQRKHYLYHNYFMPASSFSIFLSKGVPFGVTICLDTNYFEPARLLALQGAAILFSPMCNRVSLNHPYAKRPNYYSHFVARSFDNRCWLVTADWICPNDGSTICPGHSVIYDPDGHEVTLFNRGTQNSSLFSTVEKLQGNRDGDLKALEGRRWDAIIDTSGHLPRVVEASSKVLAQVTNHYTFISTIGVYENFSKLDIDEDYPLAKLSDEKSEEITKKTYGALRAYCEDVICRYFPNQFLIIRPGLIVGPLDPTNNLHIGQYELWKVEKY